MKTKEKLLLVTGSLAIFIISAFIIRVSLIISFFIALLGLVVIAFVLWRKSKKEEQEINEVFMENVEKE